MNNTTDVLSQVFEDQNVRMFFNTNQDDNFCGKDTCN